MPNDLNHLSVEQIEQAVSLLNVGSVVDVFELSVECILFAHPVIYLHLKALYIQFSNSSLTVLIQFSKC